MSGRDARPAVAGMILAVAAGLAVGGCASSAKSSVASCSARHAAAGQASSRPPGAPGLAAERGTSLRDAIDHLAEEAQRLRRLAAVSDVA